MDSQLEKIEKEFNQDNTSKSLSIKKLELTKSYNRLGESVLEAVLNNSIDDELADLINMTCEIAKLRLDFVQAYYVYYNNDIYLKAYNESKNTYVSLYLRVKILE